MTTSHKTAFPDLQIYFIMMQKAGKKIENTKKYISFKI